MAAKLNRDVDGILRRFGLQRRPDFRPHPKAAIDYDALYDDVVKRYPKIMKRLAE